MYVPFFSKKMKYAVSPVEAKPRIIISYIFFSDKYSRQLPTQRPTADPAFSHPYPSEEPYLK